jgi:hypothetical protein
MDEELEYVDMQIEEQNEIGEEICGRGRAA